MRVLSLYALLLSAFTLWGVQELKQRDSTIASLRSDLRRLSIDATELATSLEKEERRSSQLRDTIRDLRMEVEEQRRPCGLGPRVFLSPTVVAPGSFVTVVGDCFLGDLYQNAGNQFHLAASIGEAGIAGAPRVGAKGNPEVCEFEARTRSSFSISNRGYIRGWFVVPSVGTCIRQGAFEQDLVPGSYRLELGPRLSVGRLRVRLPTAAP